MAGIPDGISAQLGVNEPTSLRRILARGKTIPKTGNGWCILGAQVVTPFLLSNLNQLCNPIPSPRRSLLVLVQPPNHTRQGHAIAIICLHALKPANLIKRHARLGSRQVRIPSLLPRELQTPIQQLPANSPPVLLGIDADQDCICPSLRQSTPSFLSVSHLGNSRYSHQ